MNHAGYIGLRLGVFTRVFSFFRGMKNEKLRQGKTWVRGCSVQSVGHGWHERSLIKFPGLLCMACRRQGGAWATICPLQRVTADYTSVSHLFTSFLFFLSSLEIYLTLGQGRGAYRFFSLVGFPPAILFKLLVATFLFFDGFPILSLWGGGGGGGKKKFA